MKRQDEDKRNDGRNDWETSKESSIVNYITTNCLIFLQKYETNATCLPALVSDGARCFKSNTAKNLKQKQELNIYKYCTSVGLFQKIPTDEVKNMEMGIEIFHVLNWCLLLPGVQC